MYDTTEDSLTVSLY